MSVAMEYNNSWSFIQLYFDLRYIYVSTCKLMYSLISEPLSFYNDNNEKKELLVKRSQKKFIFSKVWFVGTLTAT